MKIALDAMGGDHAPEVAVRGALDALRDFPRIERLFVVGDLERIGALWQQYRGPTDRVEFVPAQSIVNMEDDSTAPLRKKRDSSIAVAAELVRDGHAEALVSAGHTGAAVATTTVRWRMLPGIERPGICSALPANHGHTHILDAGANVEAKVQHMVAYGVMGTVYCKRVLGIDKPKVGLMSVGEEDHKGTDFTRKVFSKLKDSPIHFVGNVEGSDLFRSGIDIVVCDGFTGNVVLKTAEATAQAMMQWLKESIHSKPRYKLGALMAKPAFAAVKKRASYDQVGGSPLLGVNGICIIGHGSSNAAAIRNALRVAAEAIEQGLISGIEQGLAQL